MSTPVLDADRVVAALRGAFAREVGRQEMLLEVLPPLDWDKVGGETWGDVVRQVKVVGTKKVFTALVKRDKTARAETWDAVFRPVRQPDWWQGDSLYHPPAYTEPASELERRLAAGEFVVTSEITPPLSARTDKLIHNIEATKHYVSALNFTDNASATPRMTSWACSQIALAQEAEPVLQISARNLARNRSPASTLIASFEQARRRASRRWRRPGPSSPG